MGVAGRPRRQSRGAVLRLGDSAGPQRSSQAAGGASLWAPGLRTAGGGGPEGAERQRACPLRSLAGGVFSAQPRKPKPPSQWHPPESPFGTREAAPTHALAGGSGFPKGRTPHFPLLSMEPATGRPCPDVRVSLASPSLGWRGPRGLPWPSDTREATGDMGSRAFKAPSSRPLPPTAGPLLPAPAHRRGRLCTKSPRTRAPCRVPSRTLRRRPSPAPPCGDSGSGVAGAKFQAEPRSHTPPAAGLCSACPALRWQCLYCPPNLLDTFEKQEFSHKSSDVLGL